MKHLTDRNRSSARRGAVFTFGLAAVLLAGACGGVASTGSGDALVEQLDLDLSGVDSVAASDIWNVELVVGEVPGVEIRIDDNLRDRVDVTVDGDEVQLDLRNGILKPEIGFNAVVTLSSFDRIEASDASEMSGSGLTMDDLVVSGSDSAKISLSGDTESVEVEATDASKVDLSGLQLVDATISASDAARLDVAATGSVSGKASDAAKVTITGGASLDVRTEDAASISSE